MKASTQQLRQPIDSSAEESTGARDLPHGGFDFRGPWFNTKTAAAYIPCASVKAFYMWRTRHGIISRSNGSVAKADLDRVLARRKPRRVMHPHSLANLHARNSRAVSASTVSPIFRQSGS